MTSRRPGFTLVELLMVIAIIGMLTALVSVAAVKVMARARQAENTLTIDTLDQAVQNAKTQYGVLPPDCSNLGPQGSSTSTPSFGQTYRQNRILAFFRKAFPRVVVTGYGPSNSTNPPLGSLQRLSQYSFVAGQSSQFPAYPGSSYMLGDLNNLDPAEALVFFIGGPPATGLSGTPQAGQQLSGGGNYSYALAGFSANPQNPLVQGGPRLTPLYAFNQGRLGDADGDGWPEYYPPNAKIPQPPGGTATQPATPWPPYVYFDSVTYESWISNYGITSTAVASNYPGAYPYYSDSSSIPAQPTQWANQNWGLAVPYTSSSLINTTINSNDFVNPQKFQIIGAGADNFYSTLGTTNLLRYFPSTINHPLSQGDYDNVTNFAGGTLGDTLIQ